MLAAVVHLWAQAPSENAINPKVRAITAFVRLDQGQYPRQIAETIALLSKVKSEFASAGYDTETIRITTQPLAELVSGMPEEKALAYLRALDDLSAKENFDLNVGPAMLHDSDDPATMHLLEQVLSTLPHINSSAIIADEDGIHWKAIHRTAELVHYVSEHSPRAARAPLTSQPRQC